MAGDGESNKTKIVLGIVAGVLVLGVLCCGGLWFAIPKEAKSMFGQGVSMARQMATGVQAYDKGFADDFGEDGRWQLGGAGQGALLLVGVPDVDALDDDAVADLQDRAWARYASAFKEGGVPLDGVALGRAGKRQGGSTYQGEVADWTKHVVDAATLVERTGIAAPPVSEFFESVEKLKNRSGAVKVDVQVKPTVTQEDAPVEDAPATDEPREE